MPPSRKQPSIEGCEDFVDEAGAAAKPIGACEKKSAKGGAQQVYRRPERSTSSRSMWRPRRRLTKRSTGLLRQSCCGGVDNESFRRAKTKPRPRSTS